MNLALHRTVTVVTALAALAVTACGTTVDDRPLADPAPEQLEGSIVDSVLPATTEALAGTAAELLPELAIDMSRLSALIAEGGAEDEATIARIEQAWAAIRDEIAATHPHLVDGITTTIDMARGAVDTTRPADADKAFSLLSDLVDSYTGDG